MAAKKKTATKKAATKKPTTKRAPRKRAPVKKGPTAGSIPDKSQYMEDVMPERAAIDMPGQVARRADGHGRQVGRAAPARRKYGGQYDMVDANTAMQRAIARQNGELPPIKGGLDFTQSELEEEDDMTDFDPLGSADPQPGDPELEAEERRLADLSDRHGGGQSLAAPTPQPVGIAIDTAPPALRAQTRVTLELQDGLMTMPAIAVLQETYGITILLPLRDDGVTFIPKPGSSVTITHAGNRWPCYFPGTHFTWEDMKCMGLVFVRADEEA